MATLKKHQGQLQNTGRKVVVAFMQLPGDDSHALVIDTDALPERIHQAVMFVLESDEGQKEKDFANILSRRVMPDTGYDMLTTLHNSGYLMRTPISNVTMLPLPNQPIALTELIKIMNPPSSTDSTILDQTIVEQQKILDEGNIQHNKFNPHAVNTQAGKDEENYAIARNLIILAEEIELEANKKREEAYRICPNLRPQTRVATQQPQIITENVAKISKVDVKSTSTPAKRGRKAKSASA